MKFGAIGDVHGHFDALDRVMARHPDIAFWVCPGDVGDETGAYPEPRAPLYWIKGNNEDFDFVVQQPPGGGTIANLHYIPNGVSVDAHGLRLAGLGGTFAPTWYETPAGELPPFKTTASRSGASAAKTARDDKRRHFVQEEVARCSLLTDVDLFLSHEAPRPFILEQRRGSGPPRRIDAGKTPVNQVLAAMRPRLHLFGHHHKYTTAEHQGVPSIGLEMVTESYLIIDGKTLAHQRLDT